MKFLLALTLTFIIQSTIQASPYTERVRAISSIMYQHTDSAIVLANNLLEEAIDEGDEYATVKSNFILAYIYDDIEKDYGKAIIYYLEAIRYAENSSYETHIKDLSALYKNCGVIFRMFKSFHLAEQYYQKASEFASLLDTKKDLRSINFNYSGLLMDQERYDEAISILKILINETEQNTKDFWKYNNRLGLAYFDSDQFELAIEAHENSLNYSDMSEELKAYTLNNIGRCLSALDKYDQAISHFNQALAIKKTLEDNTVLFSTYFELGELEMKRKRYSKSLAYLDLAEQYIEEVNDIKNFNLYKIKADVLFNIKEYNEAKRYEDLYSENLNQYLVTQEELQEADRSYNMDLITKRYFDEVAKQERIASILFYSKLISGSLLALLLMTIGYNWYQKVKLRRSIVQELMDLKVIN